MPSHQSGITNVWACCRVLKNSNENACQDQHDSETRRPKHDITPERIVQSQRREVQPMGNGCDPGQCAAATGCHERHFGGFLRNVKLGVSAVIHTYLVKRELTAV